MSDEKPKNSMNKNFEKLNQEEIKELINKQKMCLICRDSQDFPYTPWTAFLHETQSFHFTSGTTHRISSKHPNIKLRTLDASMRKLLGLQENG